METVPLDADDLMEALLAHFPENTRFTAKVETLHLCLYHLSKKYPIVFRDMFFDMDRPFPFCEDVEFTILTLAGCGMLGFAMDEYIVLDNLINHYNEKNESKDSNDEIAAISAELLSDLRGERKYG